jgi:hypothetical protein
LGFSGGGSGVLLNHEHDGSLPLDGGPLDFKNITQSSMSAGSLTFSDSNHLQELVIGNAGEQLLVNGAGTAPIWSAEHSEVWRNLFGAELGVAASTFDTGVLNSGVKMRWLHIQGWINLAGSDSLDIRIGNGTVNTTANYNSNVIYNGTSTTYAGETFGRLTNVASTSSTSINIFLDNNPSDMNRWSGWAITSNNISELGGFLNVTPQADRIEIRTNGGANISANSYLQVFGAV